MYVTLQKENKIATLTFGDGGVNVLSKGLIQELNEAITDCVADDEIHVIMLQSCGKVFCAGANLKELYVHEAQDVDAIEAWQFLATCPKPTLAMVDGACLGGGFELALMCDFIYASMHASFSFPEITLGLIPGGGGHIRLARRVGYAKAIELLMTGKKISPAMAMELGIINDVASNTSELYALGFKIATQLAAYKLEALKSIKAILKCVYGEREHEMITIERQAFYKLLLAPQGKEGIEFFLKPSSGM